jgi:MazG family protein
MASEEGRFDIADSLLAINSKLVRRHPHVFADGDAKTSSDVLRRWDEIKAAERESKAKESKGQPRPKGLLDGVPRSFPALVEAQKIAAKAAGAGLDEERVEIDAARATGNPAEIEDEIGDLLFVIVNIARFLKVDPEQALRKTNSKFRRRFGQVEAGLAAHGKTPQQATIDEMEALWQAAKLNETKLNQI